MATPEQQAKPVVAVATAVVVVVILAAAAAWLWWPSAEQQQPLVARAPAAAARTGASSPPPDSPSPSPSCATVAHPFRPRTITVPGVTRGAAVVTPPRDAHGVPGAPPLTRRGKTEFAWDRKQRVRPGDEAGNVLLNAHTWPDGSALGNRLLAELQRGDRIIVRGHTVRLCYRVTKRVEVLASRGLPRYYRRDGRPQLAIVVCSGRRLGPGVWTKRTVWFAKPSA